MDTIDDVHLQFANFFKEKEIAPYLYLLSQKMEEGSTCLFLPEIAQVQKDNFPFDLTRYKISDIGKNHLVGDASGRLDRPFILDKDRLYLQRYFRYETVLTEKIKQLVIAGNAKKENRIIQLATIKNELRQLLASASDTTDWQKIAAVSALLNDFTIITGGPGTGKTTTVSKILELCLSLYPAARIALAAPTGKAAARMTESLHNAADRLSPTAWGKIAGLKPSTIHRLLGTVKDSIYFKHNLSNPLPYDIVVVDECSMIDIALFSKLLDAIGANTRLILLGDKDQLASVEVGSLFGDLCNTVQRLNSFSPSGIKTIKAILEEENPVVNAEPAFLQNNIIELRESRRFDKNKGIGKLADAVLGNKRTALNVLLQDSGDEQVAFDFNYAEAVWKNFANGYMGYIEEKDIAKALRLFDKQRFLCAVHEGEYGTNRLNQKIEDYLAGLQKLDRKDAYYENRPVMVLENNYELGLYNGDIGILRRDTDGVVKAWFLDGDNPDTGLKSVLPGLISNMETVFAMTIHKSQGSEFNNVMIILPEHDHSARLLTREILYTAITRAKDFVCIAASEQAIHAAMARQVQRSSGVSVRF